VETLAFTSTPSSGRQVSQELLGVFQMLKSEVTVIRILLPTAVLTKK
jgi:hypothetical protein